MTEAANQFFRDLYLSQYDTMLRIAYRMTGEMNQAADLVQQAFLLAIYQEEKLIHHPSPPGWLITTLRNLIRNERNRELRHQNISLESVENLVWEEMSTSLDFVLPTNLSPEERNILIWRFEEQLEYSEIAKRLCISESSCRSRVSRALVHCRKLLQMA